MRSLLGAKLRKGWEKLEKRLAGKGKAKLEEKWRRWFDTYLEEAVRAAEIQSNERLRSLASEADASSPDPLTMTQLVSLNQRSEPHITVPDNSWAVGGGGAAGALAGAALGSVVPILGTGLGAFVGWIVGAAAADNATQQEPDYAAAYTEAARTDWDMVAATIEQAGGEQFAARLKELIRLLGSKADDLRDVPAAREELLLRKTLKEKADSALCQID